MNQPVMSQKEADLLWEAHQKGFPGLVGSPKQCVWALDIRSRFAEELEMILDEQRQYVRDAETQEKWDMVATLAGAILQETAARWWIDNRYESPKVLLRSRIVAKNSDMQRGR